MLPPEIGQNLTLIHSRWIPQRKPHEKTIQLCLRQWKSAFILNWILGCQNQKRTRQITRDTVYGHLLFLHRFQQSCLCAWRGAIDLICQKDVDENRTRLEFKGQTFADNDMLNIFDQRGNKFLNIFHRVHPSFQRNSHYDYILILSLQSAARMSNMCG